MKYDVKMKAEVVNVVVEADNEKQAALLAYGKVMSDMIRHVYIDPNTMEVTKHKKT